MLGEILEIKNNYITIQIPKDAGKLMNMYVKVVDSSTTFVGEIISISKESLGIKLIGELNNNSFRYGLTKNPSLNGKVELLNAEEIKVLFGINNYKPNNSLYLGKSYLYENYPIYLNINNLFANHFVILGNSGSGKSCGVARLLQNLFYKKDASPINSTFFIIDAYGEYHDAFSKIDYVNPNLRFKYYTSDTSSPNFLKIPLWLLSVDDICLLLEVNSKNQIPIVEKALKLVRIFVKNDEESNKYKNSIIAKALLDVFINGKSSASIRDQIYSILTKYNTKELNLNSEIYVPGYTRPLKQCLNIDATGKIRETELVMNFLQKFVLEDLELKLPDISIHYTLKDLLYALDFALIDEGVLNSERVYNVANELRVRLATIVNSEYCDFFNVEEHYDSDAYFKELTTIDGMKAQVINIDLANINDRFAKVIAKIYSKFIFDYEKNSNDRAKNPVHIVLEEAHRYVQNDTDVQILGYNIFERIAKEGRKYGVMLVLISQRPSELSQTVLSQCSNFLIFKISHPSDIEYIRPMIPFIDDSLIEKIKNQQVGNALIFGNCFSFPTIVNLDLASPLPASHSSDIANCWF